MAPREGERRRWSPPRINPAHFGMGVLFLTWLVFAYLTRDDPNGRPEVLDLLLGSIGGIWFGWVVREQGRKDEVTAKTADRAEATGNRAETTADRAEAKADRALEQHDSGGGE